MSTTATRTPAGAATVTAADLTAPGHDVTIAVSATDHNGHRTVTMTTVEGTGDAWVGPVAAAWKMVDRMLALVGQNLEAATITEAAPVADLSDTLSSCCRETYRRNDSGSWGCYACGRTAAQNRDRVGPQASLFTAGGRAEQLGFGF